LLVVTFEFDALKELQTGAAKVLAGMVGVTGFS
jgi:hypothetical protein